MSSSPARLVAEELTLGYERRIVAENLSVAVPDGGFTAIVGPNACGKSTLLRALARLLSPKAGTVVLDGRAAGDHPPKDFARQVGLLPQTASAPDGITVRELVGRGRFPHQTWWRPSTSEDAAAVDLALEQTDTTALADRRVDELSGGQRQRVWVAMALAQQAGILLLDEPTTFLDIAHQVELMDLFAALNRRGVTVVAVLHDLNHAARYASHVIAMRDGQIRASGVAREVVTAHLVEEVFGLRCVVIDDPETGTPLVVPRAPSL
ncbi:hypothetical protein BHE97_09615 [Aeromicrobium sp. PE09-221]|uniref:ABC transporter ATP-binding protein n=1 Tax=Aeromicrobium sp. PE09-221 TaxID=1898043 RepID=UPI000B3EA934|nr:ABC transporter ATP-binding protein [Aeromicrobium sp. PE09-221]OUZ09710.1 hypothetical protein BHE97_09615 [Aeromicrobium sp. PE09-221]